jgi:histidinol-phosphate aminotransferase
MLEDFYPIIEEHVQMVLRERERLMRELSNIECVKVFPSDANFFLFKLPTRRVWCTLSL